MRLNTPRAFRRRRGGKNQWLGVFLFFPNRLGCMGSLLVSALLTIVLLIILGVL